VALDGELNREVALKQILDAHAADPVSRQRFLVEAEISGGLEHPGIVPVYGLGADGDGRPFYAMRFIRGDSLKEAIDRFHADPALRSDPGARSLALRGLLRRFIDVCNAIAYAHSRGVLHRDIKPGNVIVGRHGETLVVDWGLAKPTGRSEPGHDAAERTLRPSTASGSAETLPGSALGTLAYMSPEQAAGDVARLGPRSDVYGLGATLYCLLTGKPPHEGDVADVLQAVGRGAFRLPRAMGPSVDRALEAVCLKAMAAKPEDRYASGRALADDAERWMADEPVAAWREPWARTLLRWLTRHRTGVTSVAAAGLAGVVGLVSVLAVQASANAELTRSRAAVQARYDLAVEAIKTFHTGVSEDFLLKEDKFKGLSNRLLKSAADFYGKLSALLGKETDLASRRALARSNYELAELTDKVGHTEEALAAHRAVLAARRALAAEAGADMTAKVDLSNSLRAVGRLLEAVGKTEEVLSSYEQGRQAVSAPDGGPPDVAAARAAFAAAEYRAGDLLRSIGRTAEGLRALNQARDLQVAIDAAAPGDNDQQAALARSHSAIGIVLSETGQPAEALRSYESARAIRQELAHDNPTVTQYQRDLARSHNNIGNLLDRTGRPSEAEESYRDAFAIRQELAAENPSVTAYQRGLASSLSRLGKVARRAGSTSEALDLFRDAVAVMKGLPTFTTENRYGLACYAALEAGAAADPGSGVPRDEAAALADRAMAELRQAVVAGYRDLGWMQTDTDLDVLRGREDFQLLMMDLAMPAEPFARDYK
jgi:serine/threonine-protein kinase